MVTRGKLCGLVMVAGLSFAGCASPKQTSPIQSRAQYADDHAYALLFDLLGDEKDVSKLLIVKHARPRLTVLVKEISRVAKEALRSVAVSREGWSAQ